MIRFNTNKYTIKLLPKLIFILVFILTGCNSNKQDNAEARKLENSNIITLTDAQYNNAGIEVSKILEQHVSANFKISGKIDVPPQNMVSVSIPLGGFLKSTQLLPGMPVKKGEVIATMEDQQYIQLQQEYLIARARLKFTEGEFNRQKDLNINKASSDKTYQMAEAEYQGVKVTLSALAEKLKLININPDLLSEKNLSRSVTIYSPIDGYVSKVNVNIGKYASPTDVLFELVNPNDIHLNLHVFEKDLNKLFMGQQVIAYTNQNPEKKYPCEIILISQNVSDDRGAEVHCHFKEYDKNLLPGMYMNAEVELHNKSVMAINSDAVLMYEGKNYVFIDRGKHTYELIEIVKGVSEGNITEITSPESVYKLNVVSSGAYTLLMQLKNKTEE